MENKYQIIALIGESAAGKDYIQNLTCRNHPLMFHKIVSCTTRPMRDNEVPDEAYHFISLESFTRKVLNGDMLEATEYRDWFYGTPVESLSLEKINIGVFNPAAIDALLEDPRLDVLVLFVDTDDKTRMLRSLNREEEPDCAEICRRYFADKKDFADIDFEYYVIKGDDSIPDPDIMAQSEDFLSNIKTMWSCVTTETGFSTIVRWENSMLAKTEQSEAADDKDKIE